MLCPPFQKSIFSALESDPLFARPGRGLPAEQLRELTFLRCRRILQLNFLRMDALLRSPLQLLALVTCLGMYDWSLATKAFLHAFVSRREGRGRAAATPPVGPRGGPPGCPGPGPRGTLVAGTGLQRVGCRCLPGWLGCQCSLAFNVF